MNKSQYFINCCVTLVNDKELSIEKLLGIVVKVLKILLCLSFYMSFGLFNSISAKQISFNKQLNNDHYRFSYQWLDHNKEPQSMSFSLTKTALFQRFRALKRFQGDYAQKTIMRQVKQQVNKTSLPGAQAVFLRQNGKTVIQVKGHNEANVALFYQKIKEIERAVTTEFFKKNYFQHFTTPEQEQGIKMDYVSIARDSVADFKTLKPLILEQVSIKNIRKVTDYVLSFVQSIPYSPLTSRIDSSGAGFNPPAKLIWENQGDCDSKVTLTATILRALMPRIDMAMIYIDQHAFIGIAVPANAGEMTINYQGVSYLLGEPTGPGKYRLGKLAPESELAVNQGRYVAEKFHSDGSI